MDTLLDDFEDPRLSLVHRHAVELATVTEPEADSVLLDVLLTGNKCERDFRLGRIADLLAETIVRVVHLATHEVLLEIIDERLQMRGELVGDRDARDLHRGEPDREGAGIMLKQDGEETLNGAEQGTVNHHRALVGAICRDILKAETLRQVEVELDGGHLPGTADGIARLDGDLRAVERGASRIVDEFESGFLGDLGERIGRFLPDLVGADELVGILGRQFQIEVVEAEVLEHLEHEGEQAAKLRLHLLARAVDMRIILSQTADSRQAVHHAGLLVAVHRAEFEQTQRQFAVRTLT